MADPLIDVRGVKKDYGGLRPLRLAALTLVPGDRVAITGLDAPAAEILVNILTGATLPDEGEVETVRPLDIRDCRGRRLVGHARPHRHGFAARDARRRVHRSAEHRVGVHLVDRSGTRIRGRQRRAAVGRSRNERAGPGDAHLGRGAAGEGALPAGALAAGHIARGARAGARERARRGRSRGVRPRDRRAGESPRDGGAGADCRRDIRISRRRERFRARRGHGTAQGPRRVAPMVQLTGTAAVKGQMKLLLFDVDGTLVLTGGAAVRAMNDAFHDVFGVAGAFEHVPMPGRTDGAILEGRVHARDPAVADPRGRVGGDRRAPGGRRDRALQGGVPRPVLRRDPQTDPR